ncbi:hypothetical protein GCK72_002464 [Caenorhabditis remanei]|uniref:AB hydrolase-1 domain-containing protein n=1 Tax=Caenorhabditis remanei TaxID=31234 RepID=A0A6A5HWC1_CAERE|nr:hypothetical protein GCK72_002464 [Caenorhabditis remanei]KAF1770643.1 hypothetical protein GCK72_002464 [Caenorhabditis remanei]
MATAVEIALAKQPYFDLNSLCKTVFVTYKAGPRLDKLDICNKPGVRGTVVSLAGSPGSHNDIKYMRDSFEKHNIRLVCTNWPGSEFVTGGLRDSYTNEERNSYVKALMEKLGMKNVEKLIVMGHSRGGESALQMACILSEDRSWPLIGAVMINSPGFVMHRGISVRMGTINTLAYLIKLRWKMIDCVLFPVLDWFYNDFIGLRVADGKVSAAAILPMQTFAFEKQKASMDEMKKKPWVRMFYAYGSKDFLVAESDSEELAMYFKGDHYVIKDKKESEEAIPKIWNSYANGQPYVTANFTEEGHYLQKTYPEFLIQVLGGMFDVETKSSK